MSSVSQSNDPAVWIREALSQPATEGGIPAGQAIVARAVSEALKGSHKSRDWLFNRAYGRPAQQIEISNGDEVDIRATILAALTSPQVVTHEPKVLTPPTLDIQTGPTPPWEDD